MNLGPTSLRFPLKIIMTMSLHPFVGSESGTNRNEAFHKDDVKAWTFGWLPKRARTGDEFMQLAKGSLRTCEINEEALGLEIRLRK